MSARALATAALMTALAASVAMGEEINPVLGKINDFAIREIDLDRLVAGQPLALQKQLQDKPELKVNLVQELLMKTAIARKARKESFDKKPEFREQLSYLIDDFLAREYVSKVVVKGVTVPDEEVAKFYKENEKDFFVPESAKLRHIFIQVAATASAKEKEQGRLKAAGLLQRLQKGEDFAKLAAEASEDADTAKKGGDLGRVSPGKTNSEEFEKAAFALKPGEISDIVQSPYGYHIIKSDEKQERRIIPLEEAKPQIVELLQKELETKKARDFMEKMAKENGLEVYADRITGKTEEPGKKKDN